MVWCRDEHGRERTHTTVQWTRNRNFSMSPTVIVFVIVILFSKSSNMSHTVRVNKKFTFRFNKRSFFVRTPFRFITVYPESHANIKNGEYRSCSVSDFVLPRVNVFVRFEVFNSRLSTVLRTMVFSSYIKQRILLLWGEGYKAPTIAKLLREQEMRLSGWRCQVFEEVWWNRQFSRRAGSGWPSKLAQVIKLVVQEHAMQLDDEMTAVQLYRLLRECSYNICWQTVLRCGTSLGWMFRGSAYCQHICDGNKANRLAWAWKHLEETFEDVIWTDECSIQMELHRRFCCRKQGQAPKPKPR